MTSGSPPNSMFPGSLGFWDLSSGRPPINVHRVAVNEPVSVPYSMSPGEGGFSMCSVVIGVVVVFLVLWLLTRTTGCARSVQRVVPTVVNGMRAMVSAKKTSVATEKGNDHHIKADASLVKATGCKPGETNCVHNLTPCTDESCKDFKSVPSDAKKKMDKNVTDFLSKHPRTMIMIYAPWCPHCHTAMPKFMEASKECDMPFALVNAELVSPTMLQGEGALFNVQFFPYILKRDKVGDDFSDSIFKDAPTKENLAKHAKMDRMDHFFA